MKPIRLLSIAPLSAFALVWLALPQIVRSETSTVQPPSPNQSKVTGTAIATPIYKPPVRGAPGGRVGGGTRGNDQTFVLSVLAPNHTGLTAEEQPVLYWYLSKSLSSPIEFTINDGGMPLVEKTLTPPFEPGLHRLRLSEFGIHLAAGKQYQWFVGLVSDPKRRSRYILAGATIERVEKRPDVAAADTERVAVARQHAEAGIWYDAIAILSEQIEATPADSIARSHRAALLQQVGLHEIADYDLSRAGTGKER